MSRPANAKPILRRPKAVVRQPRVLLTVPDLSTEPEVREITPEPADFVTENPPVMESPVGLADTINNSNPVSERDPMATHQAPILGEVTPNEPSLESVIDPPDARIGDGEDERRLGTSNPSVPHSEKATATRSSLEQRIAAVTRMSAIPQALTRDPMKWFTEEAKKNLGMIGTIAAAVVFCTLVARSMKNEHANQRVGFAEASDTSELNDASPGNTSELETVTVETPNFEPNQLRQQNNVFGQAPNGAVANGTEAVQTNAFSGQVPQTQMQTRQQPIQAQQTAANQPFQSSPFPTQQAGLQPGSSFQNGFPSQPVQQQRIASTGLDPRAATSNVNQLRSQQGSPSNTPIQTTNPAMMNPRNSGGGFDPFALPAFGGKPSTAPSNISNVAQTPTSAETQLPPFAGPSAGAGMQSGETNFAPAEPMQAATFQPYSQPQNGNAQQDLRQASNAIRSESTQLGFNPNRPLNAPINNPSMTGIQSPQNRVSQQPGQSMPTQPVGSPANQPIPQFPNRFDNSNVGLEFNAPSQQVPTNQSTMVPRVPSLPAAPQAGNAYPTTAGATFDEIAADMQNDRFQTEREMLRRAEQTASRQSPFSQATNGGVLR